MTDGGSALQPGAEGAPAPFRPRSAYAGHEAFGDGDGALLIEPNVARELRLAAESATLEGRIAGGLLYGRRWTDEQGAYLVISEFLEAGPKEDPGDQVSRDGRDEFTLSAADLRLLRRDGARMYTSSAEAGWWRSLRAAGQFSPRDLQTQYELVEPGGAGLLVFGSGLNWGAAYVGPDALPPGADGLEPSASRLAPETMAGLRSAPDFGSYPDGEPSADLGRTTVLEPSAVLAPEHARGPDDGAGLDDHLALDDELALDDDFAVDDEPDLDDEPATALATRRQPMLTPAPQPSGPRAISPVRVPEREWGARPHHPGHEGPEMPTEVKIIVGLVCAVIVAAAVMIGMLASNALVAVAVGVVGFLVVAAFLWFARL